MGADKNKDQHMTVNPKIIEEVIGSSALISTDRVLEVGGGSGNLTEEIAKRVQFIYTVEKDDGYFSILSKKFDGVHNVRVIHGDILNVDLPQFNKIVSNPPYRILQPFFLRLVKERRQNFELCVIMVPHGFAKIITATPKSPDFGVLSALFYAFYEVEDISIVPKGAFDPKPRVTSHIMRIAPKIDRTLALPFLLRNIFLDDEKKIRNSILATFWNNGEVVTGKGLTKNDARAMMDSIENHGVGPALDKKIVALTNSEVRSLISAIAASGVLAPDHRTG